MSVNESEKWLFEPFEMPSIWNSEDDIYSLLQSFKRPRHIDPAAYDYKINFWSSLITKYAQHHHILMINESQLQSVFTKVFEKNKLVIKPQCFDTVLEAMGREGRVRPVRDVAGTGRGLGAVGRLVWGLGRVVAAPVIWSVRALVQALVSPPHTDREASSGSGEDLVIEEAAGACLSAFMEWVLSRQGLVLSARFPVLSRDNFERLLAQFFPHDSSRALARFLLNDEKLIEIVQIELPRTIQSQQSQGQGVKVIEVVRLAQAGHKMSNGTSKEERAVIGGLMEVKETVVRLTAEERQLEQRIRDERQTIKRYLATGGRKEEALRRLKRMKQIEGALERKQQQLQNLEEMGMQIEASCDNMAVLGALGSAAAVLKSRSMNLDAVQDVMVEVGDALADQNEISASLGALGFDETIDDAAQLESELADLLADTNPTVLQEECLPRLPDVPQHSPQHPVSPEQRLKQNYAF